MKTYCKSWEYSIVSVRAIPIIRPSYTPNILQNNVSALYLSSHLRGLFASHEVTYRHCSIVVQTQLTLGDTCTLPFNQNYTSDVLRKVMIDYTYSQQPLPLSLAK